MPLDMNEVVKFMEEFEIDMLNRFGELIIDYPTNTYATISECQNMEDVKMRVVFNLCRPIYKGLDEKDSKRLLRKLNAYFLTNLTKEDLGLMYRDLCYRDKFDDFKDFIKRGFPVWELIEED